MNKVNVIVKKVIETTTTEYVEVASGIKVTQNTIVRVNKDTGERTEKTTELVECDFKNKLGKNGGQFYIVKPEFVHNLRFNGWMDSADDEKLIIRDKPFTYIANGEDYYEVVRLSGYDNTAYDADGNHLTVAVHFDYISGRVHDKRFHIEALLDHLNNDCQDVTVIDNYGQQLRTIPEYNRDCDSGYYYLSFKWHPENELFRAYQKRAEKIDWFCGTDIIHQMLGNDKFLKDGEELYI